MIKEKDLKEPHHIGIIKNPRILYGVGAILNHSLPNTTNLEKLLKVKVTKEKEQKWRKITNRFEVLQRDESAFIRP